jgi:predicted secreted protein with PEFG-CTERM motif
MDNRIFYSLIILAVISTGTAFAEGSLISVQTDDKNYDEGDSIVISGKISTIIGDTQVTLQLFKGGNLIEIAQIKVSQDGNYSHTVIAQGSQWKSQGEYLVKVVYGEANIAEAIFNYTPESETDGVVENFEVEAGDGGTFDIGYAIRGGTIENMSVEHENFGLLVKINSSDDGKIILELPRKIIDAEKQNGDNIEFIILIDNIQTTYVESTVNSEVREVIINFEEGDSEIQIIGTYVIPEFGTIVMIILTIGIMSSILLTKNRFQIKI